MTAQLMPLTGTLLELAGAQDTRRLATRGTTNRNVRGSAETRRRRKEWLVLEFRADVDAWPDHITGAWVAVPLGKGCPACRCFRCGTLLTVGTVFVDRRVPGAEGGTYARNNIRPNCSECSSITGNLYRWGKARS